MEFSPFLEKTRNGGSNDVTERAISKEDLKLIANKIRLICALFTFSNYINPSNLISFRVVLVRLKVVF